MSTFAIEAHELNKIMWEADKYSLVLGDEPCSGTEQEGGISIVAGSVLELLERKTVFMFATHQHVLRNIPELIENDKLLWSHMDVNIQNGKMVLNRRLILGDAGPRRYAIDYMREIGAPIGLIDQCNKIAGKMFNGEINRKENDVMTKRENDVMTKRENEEIIKREDEEIIKRENEDFNGDGLTKTHWNTRVQMNTVCAVCNENPSEEVDHIEERHKSNEYGILDGGQSVHHGGNMVGLCKGCHYMKTQGELKIDGWIELLNGERELKYS